MKTTIAELRSIIVETLHDLDDDPVKGALWRYTDDDPRTPEASRGKAVLTPGVYDALRQRRDSGADPSLSLKAGIDDWVYRGLSVEPNVIDRWFGPGTSAGPWPRLVDAPAGFSFGKERSTSWTTSTRIASIFANPTMRAIGVPTRRPIIVYASVADNVDSLFSVKALSRFKDEHEVLAQGPIVVAGALLLHPWTERVGIDDHLSGERDYGRMWREDAQRAAERMLPSSRR